jgi:hypothetical protein
MANAERNNDADMGSIPVQREIMERMSRVDKGLAMRSQRICQGDANLLPDRMRPRVPRASGTFHFERLPRLG